MLDALRKGTGTWIAKIFIGLLVLSFAVWGISDIFGGYGRTTVAQVGDTEISGEEYRFAYQLEMRMLGRQIGRSLSAEEANQLGLDNLVLSRLIGQAALEAHGERLNLGISDRAIAEEIIRQPSFQDASGNFSRRQFEQILHANNMSEQGYVAHERKASVRRQLTQTVGRTDSVPDTLLAAMNQYQNEQRTLSYFTVPLDRIDPIGAPSESDLRAFYDDNQQTFTSPEYRKLGLIVLTPETVAANIRLTEEELRDFYEQNRGRFMTPERRRVSQVAFPDVAAAQEAHAKLQSGADFLQIAEERGYSQSDIDLGLLARAEFADPAVADAAFSLDREGVSGPVEGRFSTVLVKVAEIEPKVVRSFAEARDEIRTTLAAERARHEIMDLHDHVEDHRAAAASLPEIAKELDLTYLEVELDQRGNTPEGAPAADVPSLQRVAATAFESDVGIENDPIDTENHGVVWVDVVGVTPSRLKPFQQVKDEVAREWRAAEERSRLARMGQELVEKVRAGETFDAVARALGLEVRTSRPLKRNERAGGLPQSAVAQAFALPEGGVGSASTDGGQGRVVFQVAKVEAPPPLDDKTAEEMRDRLRAQLADDLVTQYVSGLQEGLGVRVNQTVLNQVLGRESG